MRPRVRFSVEWQELTPQAKLRHQANPGDYEHDRDEDERTLTVVCKTLEEAKAEARRFVLTGETCYGHATVQEEHRLLDTLTHLWDWEPIGEPLYIDREGDEV